MLFSIYLICILQLNKVVVIIMLELAWVLGNRTLVTCGCFQKLSALSLSFFAVSSCVVVNKSCGCLGWFEIYPISQRQTLICTKFPGWLRVNHSNSRMHKRWLNWRNGWIVPRTNTWKLINGKGMILDKHNAVH